MIVTLEEQISLTPINVLRVFPLTKLWTRIYSMLQFYRIQSDDITDTRPLRFLPL